VGTWAKINHLIVPPRQLPVSEAVLPLVPDLVVKMNLPVTLFRSVDPSTTEEEVHYGVVGGQTAKPRRGQTAQS
jgi:hypothetical protein